MLGGKLLKLTLEMRKVTERFYLVFSYNLLYNYSL